MIAKVMWALCIILLIAGGVTLRYMLEPYETTKWKGETAEARRNPYLASERFLSARGVNVLSEEQVVDFEKIPHNDIVFLANADGILVSQSQVNDAVDWVRQGGFLIVGVDKEIEGKVSILNEFEIWPEEGVIDVDDIFIDDDGESLTASERLRKLNEEIEERELEREDNAADSNDEETASLEEEMFDALNDEYRYEYFTLDLNGDEDTIHIAVLDNIDLYHPIIYGAEDYQYENEGDPKKNYEQFKQDHYDHDISAWASDQQGVRLIQIKYGSGTFTALSSADLWLNDYIGLADHAYLLSHFVPSGNTLHLFFDVNAPSIFTLIYRNFSEWVWAVFILLFLWLWRRSIRVQKVVEVPEGQRRNFAEHLASSAEFLVKNKQFETLIKPLQIEIEQLLRQHCHNFSSLNETAQVAILTEHSSVSENAIKRWVGYTKNVASQDDVFAALNIGKEIRNSL